MWNDLLLRSRSLFRRKSVEAEVDEELRFHFEKQVSKLVQSGLTAAEARRRRARLEFGRNGNNLKKNIAMREA